MGSFSPALRANPKRCRATLATALHIGRVFLRFSHDREISSRQILPGWVGTIPLCTALYRIVPHYTALRGEHPTSNAERGNLKRRALPGLIRFVPLKFA